MKTHIIDMQATIYESLQQMNNRKVKFLIAVDHEGAVVGTLTDGDIRRAILGRMSLDVSIDTAVCKSFTFVYHTDGLQQVLAAFRDARIEFLPVLDDEKRLCNIITRRALNVLLLQNQKFRIDFDFSTIDENTLEHEIFARPWGFYKTTVLNDMYQVKVIYVMPGQALSLQSHERREEYWLVVSGEGKIQIDNSMQLALPGANYFIPKGCKHRLINTSEDEVLILTEVQLGDYFGEDDIFRYEDNYNRV